MPAVSMSSSQLATLGSLCTQQNAINDCPRIAGSLLLDSHQTWPVRGFLMKTWTVGELAPSAKCCLHHKIKGMSARLQAGKHTFSFQFCAGLGGLQLLWCEWLPASTQLLTWLQLYRSKWSGSVMGKFSQHWLHSVGSETVKKYKYSYK